MKWERTNHSYSKDDINVFAPGLKDGKVFWKKCAIENIYKTYTRNTN